MAYLDAYFLDGSTKSRLVMEQIAQFRQELAEALDAGRDLTHVLAALPNPGGPGGPFPKDESEWSIASFLAPARDLLKVAPSIPDHQLVSGRRLSGSTQGSSPAVACGVDGLCVIAWIEWRHAIGEAVVATVLQRGMVISPPTVLSGDLGDCFRLSAVFGRDDQPWVFYGNAEPRAAIGPSVPSGCCERWFRKSRTTRWPWLLIWSGRSRVPVVRGRSGERTSKWQRRVLATLICAGWIPHGECAPEAASH